jgi:hypothetical protein
MEKKTCATFVSHVLVSYYYLSHTLQEFWNPTSPIQNTIILLIEKIVVAMGDELKVYIPPMVQPMLRLFLQDSSEQNMTTQKVCMVMTSCLY